MKLYLLICRHECLNTQRECVRGRDTYTHCHTHTNIRDSEFLGTVSTLFAVCDYHHLTWLAVTTTSSRKVVLSEIGTWLALSMTGLLQPFLLRIRLMDIVRPSWLLPSICLYVCLGRILGVLHT